MCRAVQGNELRSRLLPNLVRRNVFITVASDGNGEEYRLHPLFQSFLRRRLRSEIGRAGVSAEHQRFAEHFFQVEVRGSRLFGTFLPPKILIALQR